MKKIIIVILSNLVVSKLMLGQSTFASNIGAANRFLGFTNNFALYTRTNDINRMRLNGNQTQTISVYTANNLNGYLGLGTFIPAGGTNYWNNNSPFSQLHIVGRNGGFIQASGYIHWMKAVLTTKVSPSTILLSQINNCNQYPILQQFC